MSTDAAAGTDHPAPTVFLSYASEDRQAALSLRDALPGYGLEVWYDESALTGGDAWDQKIRRQIRECDFFMPVISAQTESRPEGYFRREWRLAVERTLDMADDHTFLLPVVIDDTRESGARVPDRFRTVQWTRVPEGKPTAGLEALCRRLAAGEPGPQPARKAGERKVRSPAAARHAYPPFPKHAAGEQGSFWLKVTGWGLHCAWISFMRVPRWIRWLIYVWLFAALLAKGCSSSDRHRDRVSSADDQRIKQIAADYRGSADEGDVAKLGAQIAREFADRAGSSAEAGAGLLAVPFSAPAGNPAAQKVADSTFAQMYGRVSISHHGRVGLMDKAMPTLDTAAAVELGKARHSHYVLYGGVDGQATPPSLVVKIVTVADGAVAWTESYPVTSADPATIAATVDTRLQALEDSD